MSDHLYPCSCALCFLLLKTLLFKVYPRLPRSISLTEHDRTTDLKEEKIRPTPNTQSMDILAMHPEDLLLTTIQDGCPIEDYVKEFLVLTERVACKERTLKTIFWDGLDDFLYHLMPPSNSSWSLGRYIEYALRLSYSPFTVYEVHNHWMSISTSRCPRRSQWSRSPREN